MTQSWIDYLPPELQNPGKEKEVVEFLKKLPLDPIQKKYIYLDYCYTFGIEPKREYIEELIRSGRQPL